jgi:hypothetical protein
MNVFINLIISLLIYYHSNGLELNNYLYLLLKLSLLDNVLNYSIYQKIAFLCNCLNLFYKSLSYLNICLFLISYSLLLTCSSINTVLYLLIISLSNYI